MKEENIVWFIKSQRLAWYGHLNRMEDNKNVKAIMKWNPFHVEDPKLDGWCRSGSACNEDYKLENKYRR
jgi:hypothetical protein